MLTRGQPVVGGGGGGSGGGGASSTSPDGVGGGKKGTAIAWGESDDPLPKGKNHSDVDEETAINLLAQAQQVSPHFHDFSPKELVCLARTLAVQKGTWTSLKTLARRTR